MKHFGRCATAGILATLAGASGCEMNSFFDPSVTGRFEKTPTIVPILDRISAIEDEPTANVQTSPITQNDLIPEAAEYRLTAGDSIEVRIRDFFVIGIEEPFQRAIDPRGYLDLPRLGSIRVIGKTQAEAVTAIENAIRQKQISDRPWVSVQLLQQRKQTFSVLGAVVNPSTYFIPSPDYRLLEALTAAGGVSETIPEIFVIRQIALTDEAAGVLPEPEPARGSRRIRSVEPRPVVPESERPKGEDLIDIIDELSAPKNGASGGSPSVMQAQPDAVGGVRTNRDAGPVIDLPDSSRPMDLTGTPAPLANPDNAGSSWVFVDGKWTKVGSMQAAVTPGSSAQSVVTQRVIKVPVKPLLDGAADVNIVIRPGDVIRVPQPVTGLVYMAGQVARPGPYNLPTDGRLTVQQAVIAAGGLNGLAIPERCDLVRRIGRDRQATIRIDLRAITEGTLPDFYLKPEDQINVGTNFWATPLAVIRGGFRASYGFGFILDRNFDEEVFGIRRGNSGF